MLLPQGLVGRYLPTIIANSQTFCRLNIHFLRGLGLLHTLTAGTE
jgi:hypothetical protein